LLAGEDRGPEQAPLRALARAVWVDASPHSGAHAGIDGTIVATVLCACTRAFATADLALVRAAAIRMCSPLARVAASAPEQLGTLLTTFTDLVASGVDAQQAAQEALEAHRKRQGS
jgi:hypothetical protein